MLAATRRLPCMSIEHCTLVNLRRVSWAALCGSHLSALRKSVYVLDTSRRWSYTRLQCFRLWTRSVVLCLLSRIAPCLWQPVGHSRKVSGG